MSRLNKEEFKKFLESEDEKFFTLNAEYLVEYKGIQLSISRAGSIEEDEDDCFHLCGYWKIPIDAETNLDNLKGFSITFNQDMDPDEEDGSVEIGVDFAHRGDIFSWDDVRDHVGMNTDDDGVPTYKDVEYVLNLLKAGVDKILV